MTAYNYKVKVTSGNSINGIAVVKEKPNSDQLLVELTTGKGENQSTQKFFMTKLDEFPYFGRGQWRVKMSQDGMKLYSAVPLMAQLKAKCMGVAHKDGEEPAPTSREVTFGGNTTTKHDFTILWEVVEPPYEGMTVALFCDYGRFTPNEIDWKGKKVTVAGIKYYDKNPAKASLMLLDIFDALELDKQLPIKWEDNILPVLNKRLLASENTVVLQITDGYISKVSKDISSAVDTWEDGDDNTSIASPVLPNTVSDDEIDWG